MRGLDILRQFLLRRMKTFMPYAAFRYFGSKSIFAAARTKTCCAHFLAIRPLPAFDRLYIQIAT